MFLFVKKLHCCNIIYACRVQLQCITLSVTGLKREAPILTALKSYTCDKRACEVMALAFTIVL